MTNPDRNDPPSPLPESGMGGAGDSGAHGRHPASHPAAPPQPDTTAGDAAIERRHGHRDDYRGPERREGGRTHPAA